MSVASQNKFQSLVKWAFALLLGALVIYWLNKPDTLHVEITSPFIANIEEKVANTRAGTVTACQRAKLSLPIGGQIDEIHVKEGELVNQNQLLLTLWNKDIRANLAESEAILRASLKHQQRICIIANNQNKDAQRQTQLLAQNLSSQETLDFAIATANAGKANCQAMHAETQAKQARVNTIKARLEQTFLFAPFSGIVAEITGEIGEYTTPSPPGVATPPAIDLLTQDCHYITAPIDEVDAALLSQDLPVNIRLDAFRDKIFAGTVRRISPYVQDYEKQARTVTVEVDINEHQSPHFLAGYSADIEVILAKKEQVLVLPSDLIINQNYVLVVNQDNLIEKKFITIGLSNWQHSEILNGLSANDKVISTVGLEGVKEGVNVKY